MSLLERAFKATSCSDRDAARGIAEELYNTKTNLQERLSCFAQLVQNVEVADGLAIAGLVSALEECSATKAGKRIEELLVALRSLPAAMKAAVHTIVYEHSKTQEALALFYNLVYQAERFLSSEPMTSVTCCLALMTACILLTDLIDGDDDGVPDDDISRASAWRVVKEGASLPTVIDEHALQEERQRLQGLLLAREAELLRSKEGLSVLKPLMQATARAVRYGRLSPSYLSAFDEVVNADYLKLDESHPLKAIIGELKDVLEHSLRNHVRSAGDYFGRKIAELESREERKRKYEADCKKIDAERKQLEKERAEFKVVEKKTLQGNQLAAIYYMDPVRLMERIVEELKKLPRSLVAKGNEPKLPPLPERPSVPVFGDLEQQPWTQPASLPRRWISVQPLPDEALEEQRKMAVERVLEIAPLVEDSDALKAEARLQNALASRLISDEEELVSFTEGNVKTRNRVAALWLLKRLVYFDESDLQGPIKKILQSYRNNLPLDDAGQAELPLNLPVVDKGVVDAVEKLMIENPMLNLEETESNETADKNQTNVPHHVRIGIAFLRHLVLQRPAYKPFALPSLLSLCLHPEAVLSMPSLKVIAGLYNQRTELKEEILSFFEGKMTSLSSATGMSAEAVENRTRSIMAFAEAMALSNDGFLERIGKFYVDGSPPIRRAIRLRWPRFVKRVWKLEKKREDILTMIREPPKGAELLAVQALFALTMEVTVSDDVVDAAKELYNLSKHENREWEREDGEEPAHPAESSHALALVPILGKLSQSEFFSYLPSFLVLPSKPLKLFVRKLFTKTSIPARDFLHAIHHQFENEVPLKKQIEVLDITLGQTGEITSEVCAVTLKKLVTEKNLSSLLLRTALKVLELYPKMKEFMVGFLESLFQREVWNYPRLWKGALQLFFRTFPESLVHATLLPPDQFRELLSLKRGVAERLRQRLGSKPFTESLQKELNAACERDAAARAEAEKKKQESEEQKKREAPDNTEDDRLDSGKRRRTEATA